MINLIIISVVVNSFSMKNHKSLRKLRVGVTRYMGVNWSTTTILVKLCVEFTQKTSTCELCPSLLCPSEISSAMRDGTEIWSRTRED